MTREDWKKVEDKMRGFHGYVKLRVDGRDVELVNVLDGRTIIIHVFVDGMTKGLWLLSDKPSPEQAYMRRHERFACSKKTREEYAKYEKRFGKRAAKQDLFDVDRKYVVFMPYFPSVRAVRLQYEKTFKSIELVES